MRIGIQITEVDRPFCAHCLIYCKPNTKGKAIKFSNSMFVLCDSCYSDLEIYIIKLAKSKLEEKKDGDGENKM